MSGPQHPRDALAAAAAGEPDRLAPLRALRWAAQWAAELVRDAASGGDDTRALETLAELDPAMAALAALGAGLPDLLRASFPGPSVEEQARARAAELEKWAGVVAGQRSALDELSAGETRLRETTAQYETLHERVTELRRLERIAEVLGRLDQQREAIERRLAELAKPVADAEEGIARGSEELIRLSAQQLGLLGPRARELLSRADTEQAKLAAAEAEYRQRDAALAGIAARLAELEDLRESQVAALLAHTRANREVARALDGLAPAAGLPDTELAEVDLAGASRAEIDAVAARARGILDEVDARLSTVDTALGRVLEARRALPGAGPAGHPVR